MKIVETAGSVTVKPSVESILDGLVSDGAVLMRALDPDDVGFRELTERFSDRFTCDPAKIRGTDLQLRNDRIGDLARRTARTLDKMPKILTARRSDGTRTAPFQPYGINPHNENSYIPGAFPELVWFWCREPAATGGDTMLVDGVEALAELSDRARAFIEEEPSRYELVFSPTQWQNLYDVGSESELGAILDTVDGLEWSLDGRGRLSYAYDAPQVATTMFGSLPTLRTNVLSRREFGKVGDNEREMRSDGSPMPEWFISDLLAAVEAATELVPLEAGDVIAIDNTRMMHGRTPFTGTERRILTRCGFLRPELRQAALG